jgi:hypothetical protein
MTKEMPRLFVLAAADFVALARKEGMIITCQKGWDKPGHSCLRHHIKMQPPIAPAYLNI